MAKKILAVLTLLAFVVFSWNCYSTSWKRVSLTARQSPKGEILAVQKKSGEYVEFAKGIPAKIGKDAVQGSVRVVREFDPKDVKGMKKDQRGRISELTTYDGKRYAVLSSSQTEDQKITAVVLEPISIPLSDVALIEVKTTTVFGYLGPIIIVGLVVAAVALGAALASPPQRTQPAEESCPFVYSFDGQNYVFDGEPYGGAICEGLKRTEWLGLDHLAEVNGRYRLLLTNELEESQYTDELKLLVVEHPAGTRAVPDLNGGIHAVSEPLPPSLACDGSGRDILPLISRKDSRFWLTRAEEKNPESKEDLKEKLIFEFPKPGAAKKATLVVNAWTSSWGASIAKKFLEFYGSELPRWYQEVNRFGPAFGRVMNWYQEEELYLLRIQVETQDGWKTKGAIYGGGPFISKDKAYAFDISDVSSDTLTIKLTPASMFWMLDWLAVDYTDTPLLNAVELSAFEARDRTGRDIRDDLVSSDRRYFAMPQSGDYAELVFLAPPKVIGQERTVILKAGGYYEPHIKTNGLPRWDLIKSLQTEPGFAAKYALQEYLRLSENTIQRLKESR